MNQELLTSLREKCDIVEVISEYIPLTKMQELIIYVRKSHFTKVKI